MQIVTARDWYLSGYNDGRNGNSQWFPDDAISRREYLKGYRDGYAARMATQ